MTVSSTPARLRAGDGAVRTERSAALKIVAIGGGTGLPAVLEGLCNLAASAGERDAEAVTAVVTVTDDGGSSGRLRRDFGVLPPGDIRNCLVAVAHTDSPFRQLLQHRFTDSVGLEGHPVGNLLLTALTQMTGNFVEAVERLSSMIGAQGRVIPTTNENVVLRAQLDSGQTVDGETAIVGTGSRIRRLSLSPSPRPVPEVLRALVNADGIVVGPGSLYTSVLPNLLVEGIASTISAVNGARIYVANLMTEPGETDGYSLDDHLDAIRTHVGLDLFDYILVNRRPIDPNAAARYAAKGSFPVVTNHPVCCGGRATIIECDLAPDYGDRGIKHRPAALACVIRDIVRTHRDAGADSRNPLRGSF